MKKLIITCAVLASFSIVSCDDEPKLDQQEEQAVEQQLNLDQKSMDSLEAAIKAQMEALDNDSATKDSAE
jgi:outer membrane murein-binding lipoprotein Lpp